MTAWTSLMSVCNSGKLMRLWQRTFLIDILTTPISHSYMPPQWGDLTGMCLIWTIFWVNWCCTVWSFMTWNDFWISSSPFCNVFNWHYHTGSVNKFYTRHSDTRMQEGTDWLSEGGVRGVRKPQNRTEIPQKTANRWSDRIGFFSRIPKPHLHGSPPYESWHQQDLWYILITLCVNINYLITKLTRSLWLVNQLWVIVLVNPRKNRTSSELLYKSNTPNANMVDHSVIARDKFHESEASEASVFCFDNASPEKTCFVEGLVCFISLCLLVFVFLNASRRNRNCPTSASTGK